MNSVQEGCLLILLLRGEFDRDLDVFNKMDPYVIFTLNDQKAQSSVKDEAGKVPEWNESFSFRCKEGDILSFVVFDKDPTKDDEVGRGSVNVHKDFIDNRLSYLYPVSYKGKPAGTVALQLTFLPDDTDTVKLVYELQKELFDKQAIVKEIRSEIEENLKNPPKPKPESLLLKNLLDIFETKKEKDKKFIEESIEKVEQPYLLKLKELNNRLEEIIKENEQANLKNGDTLNYVNETSYELSLIKNLSEKGNIKIRVLDLEIFKDKKYDSYIALYLDRQTYKTSVAKGMKKSSTFNNVLEAKRLTDDHMIVSLYDKCIGNDELLGAGAIDLIPVIIKKDPILFDVQLGIRDFQVGTVKIELHFIKE